MDPSRRIVLIIEIYSVVMSGSEMSYVCHQSAKKEISVQMKVMLRCWTSFLTMLSRMLRVD